MIVAGRDQFPVGLEVSAPKPRPPVSGSMAGHCRAKIWMAAHGIVPEPFERLTNMIFNSGDMYEALVLDGVKVYDPETKAIKQAGPWWGNEIREIGDPTTGEMVLAVDTPIRNRQEEVTVDGLVGHLDGIARHYGQWVVADVKSMSHWSFEGYRKKVLLDDLFSREYVFQQHFYMEGHPLEPRRAMLICIDRDNHDTMLRFIEYNKDVITEMKERLAWAKSDSPPTPEWEWERGNTIPLRCNYCEFRTGCAGLRGLALAKKGKNKWEVK